MLTKIRTFIDEKKDLQIDSEDLIFVAPGGSHLSGTNDETSDLDFRAVAIPKEDFVIGMKPFEHTKIVTGVGGINQLDDLDFEVYAFSRFIRDLYYGEIIPTEMLHTPSSLVLFESDLFTRIRDLTDVFVSKSIVRRYSGFVNANINRAFLSSERAKRPDRIARIYQYGYETKAIMNAVKTLRICIHLLKTGELILDRRGLDADELLSIKRGSLGFGLEGIDRARKLLQDLNAEKEELLATSTVIPDRADFKSVNAFYKEFLLEVIESYTR